MTKLAFVYHTASPFSVNKVQRALEKEVERSNLNWGKQGRHNRRDQYF